MMKLKREIEETSVNTIENFHHNHEDNKQKVA